METVLTDYTPDQLKTEAIRVASGSTPRSRIRNLRWTIRITNDNGHDFIRLFASWRDSGTGLDHEPVGVRL